MTIPLGRSPDPPKGRVARLVRAVRRRITPAGVAAFISLGVAVIALLQSQSAIDEVRSSDLQVSGIIDIRDGTYNGQTARLAISNVGLRPLIVTQILLLVDGVAIADANAYLTDTSLLDRLPVDPDEIADSRRPLPLTVQPREGLPIGVLFEDFETSGASARAYWRGAHGIRKFCRIVIRNPDARSHSAENDAIQVRLDYLPNGTAIAPMAILSNVGLLHERFWPTVLRGALSAPSSIEVFQPSANTGVDVGLPDVNGIRMLRLKLWRPRAARPYVTERPQVGGEPTRLPLPHLGPGSYTYSVHAHGDIVAAGNFETPLATPIEREDHTIDYEARTFCHRVLAGELLY
jgi:hypothetical protein